MNNWVKFTLFQLFFVSIIIILKNLSGRNLAYSGRIYAVRPEKWKFRPDFFSSEIFFSNRIFWNFEMEELHQYLLNMYSLVFASWNKVELTIFWKIQSDFFQFFLLEKKSHWTYFQSENFPTGFFSNIFYWI
jgi:hypothetical protein